MNKQQWTVSTLVQSNILLYLIQNIQSNIPPDPHIKKFSIKPIFDDKNLQTGKFNIEIVFKIVSEQKIIPSHEIADLGRQFVDHYLGIISFITGQKIEIINPPQFTYNFPGTKKYRKLFIPTEQGGITPPINLNAELLYNVPIASSFSAIFHWVRFGLQEKSIFSSLMYLYLALEIIAKKSKYDKKIESKCTNCGHIESSRPRVKAKLKYLIVEKQNLSEIEFNKIWGVRNDIFHGDFDRHYSSIRDLYPIQIQILKIIVKETKELLNSPDTLPIEQISGNVFVDALMDIEYIEPDSNS